MLIFQSVSISGIHAAAINDNNQGYLKNGITLLSCLKSSQSPFNISSKEFSKYPITLSSLTYNQHGNQNNQNPEKDLKKMKLIGASMITAVFTGAAVYFGEKTVDNWNKCDKFEELSRNENLTYAQRLSHYETASEFYEKGKETRNASVVSGGGMCIGIGYLIYLFKEMREL